MKMIWAAMMLATVTAIGCEGRGPISELHETPTRYRWVWPKDDGTQCAVMTGPFDENDISGWTVFTDWGNWNSPYHYFANKEQAQKFAREWCDFPAEPPVTK